MAYSDKVVKRFEDVLKNPEAHNVGRFDPADPNIGTGMVGAPACGDVMRLQLQVTDKVIKAIKFIASCCGSAIESSSELNDKISGKTLEQAEDITNKDIANALSLPPIKLHCSVLAEESIEQAIADYRRKDNYRRSDNG